MDTGRALGKRQFKRNRFQGDCDGVQWSFQTTESGSEGKGLKKETVVTAVTAVVFLAVGFLAGYIYDQHQRASAPAAVVAPGDSPSAGVAQASSGAMTQGAESGSTQGLPPGHPPIDVNSTIRVLEDQANQNPQDPEAALRVANFFYDHQRFQDAVPWYQKALKLDPKNADARTDLGTVFFSLGQPRQALEEYRKSLEIDPRHEPTIYNMIIVNMEGTHDVAAARAAWEKLHKLNPNYKGLDDLKQKLDLAQ
jgi:cytochrome c-type biogenesis protein CcmH/NrfG